MTSTLLVSDKAIRMSKRLWQIHPQSDHELPQMFVVYIITFCGSHFELRRTVSECQIIQLYLPHV